MDAGQLLGTDVLRSAEHFIPLLRLVFVAGAGNPRQAEVRQLGKAVGINHDVVRLDVLVDQLLFTPGAIKRAGDFLDNLSGASEFDDFLTLENLFHGLAADELHRKIEDSVLLADRVSLHDVRMTEPPGGTCFVDQAVDILLVVGEFRLEHLQCHRPVERKLAGKIDFAHTAPAEFTFDQEVPNHRARSGRPRREIHHLLTVRTRDLIAIGRGIGRKNLFTFAAVNFHLVFLSGYRRATFF